MKEVINESQKQEKKRTALIFRCSCGCKFISNEYWPGLHHPFNGTYPGAEEICPRCRKKVVGADVYRPLIGSKEHDKWC